MTTITRPQGHKDGCMCDACIRFRTAERVTQRETDAAVRQYEDRRGGPIGTISVSDALKEDKR